MKRWIMCVCVLAVALLTAGCGSSSFEPSVTSIYIKKDGTLTQAIVESFEKAYYSEDEFSSMVESEIAAFNENHGEELISMESLEVRDDTMYLLLDYTNADAYAVYNDTFCYVGTIGSALEEGFSFNMDFRDADYVEQETADVTTDRERSIVILKDEGTVQLEQPVRYVSNNVEILSDHMLQVMTIEDPEEYAYIVY